MAATQGNEVKFCYVMNELPQQIDNDTVYLRRGVGVYVGGELIANDGLILSDLDDYQVKSVVVSGTGDAIVDVDLTDGVLTLTRGQVGISKGPDATDTPQTLQPGGTFTAMVDTAVGADGTLSDVNKVFTLPDAIDSIQISEGTENGQVKITVTSSDGTSTSTEATPKGLGDMAFADDGDFATAEQGAKADAAMPAENGTATGAAVSLAANPTDDMDAATKKYVDDAITAVSGGAMYYMGESTTAITEGGTETPTINGEPVTPSTSGGVVLYSSKEFVWDGSVWHEFGDAGDFALKTTTITGGDGLAGGGVLASNQEISHSVPSGATAGSHGSDTAMTVLKKVTTDKFGHVTGVDTEAITVPEYEFEDNYDETTNKGATVATVNNAIGALDATAVGGSGSYISQISQTDGVVTATVGTKGTITDNNTDLVDGGTVKAALDDIRSELQLVWEVIS